MTTTDGGTAGRAVAERRAATGQHRARMAVEATAFDPDARPEPGPIAVLPWGGDSAFGDSAEAAFTDAITRAGGTVAPFSDDTRGIVYVSARDVDGLFRALDANPRVSWLQLPFAGIEPFAERLTPYAERGLVVTSAKGAYAQPVAEHALGLTIATLRQFPLRARATSWGPKTGLSLYGANVLVLGAGGIVLEFLDMLEPFNVNVTVARRNAQHPVPGADRTVDLAGFRAAIPEADVIMIAAAATPETRHVIGAPELAAMKPTAVLVNIARGTLVDTEALVRALDGEQLWGAGLDVTDPEPLPAGHPLYSDPRSIITPHSADTPEMVLPLMLERVAQNVDGFVSTGRFVGVADPATGY